MYCLYVCTCHVCTCHVCTCYVMEFDRRRCTHDLYESTKRACLNNAIIGCGRRLYDMKSDKQSYIHPCIYMYECIH